MGILSFFRRKRGASVPAPSKSAAVPPRAAERAPTAPAREGARAPGGHQAVLLAPEITEKATRLQAENWYAFRVAPTASKLDVKQAVQRQYGVHVKRVTVVSVSGKQRRRGRVIGRVPGHRRAFVALRAGERIQLEQTGKG